ncbi:MAG: zinc-ribbon domain-containing protein [Lachnospiraceae bacterium]|nr:zinc-ribbon domain-containing protein [Lachnospiraceae bacterium]
MYCTYCGAPNTDTAKFCRNCGKSLAEENLPSVDTGESTVPLGNVFQDSAGGQGGQPSNLERSYGDQPYEEGQPYGNLPYEGQSYGNPPSYGGNQPYENPPYGGQSYGNPPSYGGCYKNQPLYGSQPPYGAGQPGYGQNSYGQVPYANQPSYGAVEAGRPKKKRKKGLAIAIVLVFLAAIIGGGVFLYIRESNPIMPVKSFFGGLKEFDLEEVYDSIYWGDESSSDWISKEAFIQQAKSFSSDIANLVTLSVPDQIELEIISEGEPYEGDDGLIRKEITVEMTAEFMGKSIRDQLDDIVVVKSGKKFLFIPVWKIDHEELYGFF